MPIRLRRSVRSIALAAAAAGLLSAASLLVAQQPSPYAGLESRPIKALSAEEIERYRNGEGMGLAMAAELNGYPGPKHVLELAAELELTEEQTRAVRESYDAMHAEAVRLGEEIVERERRLDAMFAEASVTEERLRAALDEIGRLQAELRGVHLGAHLETRRLLAPIQIERYAELRGYAGGGGHSHGSHGHGHGHHHGSAPPQDPPDGPAAAAGAHDHGGPVSAPWTRRELLARGAMAALAAGLAPSWLAAGERGRPQRVAVVGAGLAGLTCALELVEAGHEVSVFEARARAGGRVRTIRETFADGLTAEAGAMQVIENHDLTYGAVQRFELPLVEITPNAPKSLFWMRGRRMVVPRDEAPAWPVELTAHERELGADGMRREYWGRELEIAARHADSLDWPPPELRDLDRLSLADLWRRNGASEAAVAVLRFSPVDLLGGGAETYSALNGLREASLRKAGRSFRIVGGNELLPFAYAARLGERIRYGTELVRIAPGAGGVNITVRDASGLHETTADRLVVAIPFSVLRGVEIDPPFSDGKMRAIEELRYSSVTRVYLQVRRRFWEDEGLSGIAMTDLPVQLVLNPSAGQPGPRGILETYVTSAEARRLAELSEADRQAAVVKQVARVYPELRASYEGGTSMCWDRDPWARGAYAWFAPGEVTGLLPHVARSEGRVHFAGDHASPRPGWMQGAIGSGLRVAAEIAAS